MPLPDGATFAGFTILALLGSGGMGEVYLAQHPRLPRQDALKVLPLDVSADEEFRARFAREADLAAKLWHPHIVGVHDRGEHEGQLWISMDYVDGLDAGRLLASQFQAGMPTGHVVSIVTAVAAALDYAHRRGLLHRDVKPANILLAQPDEDEDQQRVLLTDFGIARNIDDIGGLTATNMTLGTVAYSAPEQLMGEEVDGRADQYGLAATAFHLLSGRQLFPHSNPTVVISHHLNSPPPALGDTHPELAALDQVFAIAFAKDPSDRFPHCKDFASALASADVGTGDGNPDRNGPPPPGWFSWPRFTAGTDGLVTDATTDAPPTKSASAARAMHSGTATTPRDTASAASTSPTQTSVKSRRAAAGRSHARTIKVIATLATVLLIGALILGWHVFQQHQPPVTKTPDSATAQPSAPAPTPPAQTVLPFSGLNETSGIAVNPAGDVYVADYNNSRILKLAAGSDAPSVLPLSGINHPHGVAVDTAGALYIGDEGDNQYGRVLKVAAGSNTPTVLPFTGLYGRIEMALDSSGDLFVTSGGPAAVHELAAGSSTPSELPFNQVADASGIAVDTLGNIYVTDETPHRVWKMATGSNGPVVLPFRGIAAPSAVAVDATGALYVTDQQQNQVMRLAPGASSPTVVPFNNLKGPNGIAADASGNLYVGNVYSNQVVRLAANSVAASDNLGSPASATVTTETTTTAAAPETSAPALDDPCSDWDKLAIDPATGQEMVCGANASPATQLFWIKAPSLTSGVHTIGTPCPGMPNYELSRSTDGYVIWCAADLLALEPGGVTITRSANAGPIWVLYSP